MKSSKKCPNCQSRKIAGPHNDKGIILFSRIDYALTESYVCADCGFIQKFVKEKDMKEIKRSGKFILNPPNPQQTHCPECESKFKENKFKCHKCGHERDFDYLDSEESYDSF